MIDRRALLLSCPAIALHGRAWGEPAAGVFVMATDAEEDTYYGIWLRRVYGEALRRQGLKLEAVIANNRRSALLASQGQIDGDMVRAPSYGASHPELVMLEAPMYPVNFSLYARAATPDVARMSDLRTAKGTVVYRKGVLICERLMKNLLPPDRLVEVSTAESALGMLKRGRARFYCEVDSLMTNTLTPAAVNKGLSAFKLFDIGSPMLLHGFVQQRHAELAARLSDTLKQMKDEGLFDKYRAEALQQIGANAAPEVTR